MFQATVNRYGFQETIIESDVVCISLNMIPLLLIHKEQKMWIALMHAVPTIIIFNIESNSKCDKRLLLLLKIDELLQDIQISGQ